MHWLEVTVWKSEAGKGLPRTGREDCSLGKRGTDTPVEAGAQGYNVPQSVQLEDCPQCPAPCPGVGRAVMGSTQQLEWTSNWVVQTGGKEKLGDEDTARRLVRATFPTSLRQSEVREVGRKWGGEQKGRAISTRLNEGRFYWSPLNVYWVKLSADCFIHITSTTGEKYTYLSEKTGDTGACDVNLRFWWWQFSQH